MVGNRAWETNIHTLRVFIVINSEESIFPAFISFAIFPRPTGCQWWTVEHIYHKASLTNILKTQRERESIVPWLTHIFNMQKQMEQINEKDNRVFGPGSCVHASLSNLFTRTTPQSFILPCRLPSDYLAIWMFPSHGNRKRILNQEIEMQRKCWKCTLVIY